MSLSFEQYQARALATAFYPHFGEGGNPVAIAYVMMGISGETGEIAEQIKKSWREGGEGPLKGSRRDKVLDEIGDVLWYLAMLCSELDSSLAVVAEVNLEKLNARAAQGRRGWSDQAKRKADKK